MLEAKMDNSPATLLDVIDRILDKGLVINADICVSVVGIELLGISIRATIASMETAAKYGLAFPSGTDTQNPAWAYALVDKEACPQCGKNVPRDELLNERCPWCGWISANAKSSQLLQS